MVRMSDSTTWREVDAVLSKTLESCMQGKQKEEGKGR